MDFSPWLSGIKLNMEKTYLPKFATVLPHILPITNWNICKLIFLFMTTCTSDTMLTLLVKLFRVEFPIIQQ